MMTQPRIVLPEWSVAKWVNTPLPLTLCEMRGSVVLICCFQMLCEGCRTLALPQAERIHRELGTPGLRVIGLHMVFENHAQMRDDALEEFVSASGITFPVGVDAEGPGWWPLTLERWCVQGTPTVILVDKNGYRRRQKLGHIEDAQLDAEVRTLLQE